ncbi:MAG: sulfotransferase family 2 domain-containing protein [Verrucomicrobiota bacterium]
MQKSVAGFQYRIQPEHADNLRCRIRSFACLRGKITLLPRAHRMIGKMLFDPERKVIMDWSGKAGCTIGTMMFFRHMGLLDEAREHHPWVHNYRGEVFYERYPVTVNDLLSRKNTLIKVVRNPYTRVISSLQNKVRALGKNWRILDVLKLKSIEEITFRQFVSFLESTDLRVKCDIHYQEQVQDYELLNLRHPIICRLENLAEDIAWVNQRYGFDFDLEGLTSDHHAKVNQKWKGFAADVPWSEFAEGVPEYGNFYDAELRTRVSRLYQGDIKAYQYTFPWSENL